MNEQEVIKSKGKQNEEENNNNVGGKELGE